MKRLLIFASSFAIYSLAFSQERAQADVSISGVSLGMATNKNATLAGQPSTNISVNSNTQTRIAKFNSTDELKCVITVHNENDDDAQGTILVVVLPVEVSVTSLPSNGTIHKSGNSPFVGYVTFDLGQMSV